MTQGKGKGQGLGVLYLAVCAAPPAHGVGELVQLLQCEGWTICVIATPLAAGWVDTVALTTQTGYEVRSEYRLPGDADALPPADVIAVVPATFNTINKWAYGLADTLALALLTEAVGQGVPMVAAPALNSAQAAHPAFERNVAALRDMGVTVLYGPGVYEPGPPGTGGRSYDWEQPLEALEER